MTNALKAIGAVLYRFWQTLFPVRSDSKRERIRKIVLLIAIFVFAVSAWYLLDDLVFQPNRAREVLTEVRTLYHTDTPQELEEQQGDTTVYPEGMSAAFRPLYRRNADVRAWLTFRTTGEDLFQGTVDNPVVQGADNDYYLNHDFLGGVNKSGTLYFDSRNELSAGANNRNLIVYGHNLKSGLMFSKFNLLVSGNVAYAKRLTTLTLDTWYGATDTYKVFAVMVVNANANEEPVFNYVRTEFADEASFESFVAELRARSLYDFGDVDVTAGDELLTLSTCSNKRDTHLTDGRTVIVARKVRDGESNAVDTAKTVANADVLMPKMWYIAQDKELPAVYQ